MSKHCDLKMVLLGSAGCGKTTIVQRIVDGKVGPTISTLPACFMQKDYGDFLVGIWDTAGQEQYDSLNKFYVRGTGAAILAFDITSRHSFDRIDSFIRLLDEGAGGKVLIALVGTKADLVTAQAAARQVTVDEGQQKAKSVQALGYFEISSVTGLNVDTVWTTLCGSFFSGKVAVPKKKDSKTTEPVVIMATAEPEKKKKKKGGCLVL